MTDVITGPCTGVKDKTCAGECPVGCIYEGQRMPCTHSGECADCGACEPVCPVEAIVCEDDVPGRGPSSPARTRSSSTSSARLPRRRPKTGPLPDDTDHVASYVTSR
jgi:NAD-dependent dihydropyrimidine dehydrogenase PreA subunit